MKILLVDDQPQLIASILADYGGYQVDVVTDGHHAVQQVVEQSTPYDLIILDVHMPVMDGWQTLHSLRNNKLSKDTYVIMLTAETEETSVIRGLRRGADEYLMKPVSPSRLLAHMEAIERRIETKQLTASPTNTNAEALKQLTQREKEIMSYVVKGLSNQQISETLVISEITVKNHLANIYRKLDVSNRNQAAFIAQQMHLS